MNSPEEISYRLEDVLARSRRVHPSSDRHCCGCERHGSSLEADGRFGRTGRRQIQMEVTQWEPFQTWKCRAAWTDCDDGSPTTTWTRRFCIRQTTSTTSAACRCYPNGVDRWLLCCRRAEMRRSSRPRSNTRTRPTIPGLRTCAPTQTIDRRMTRSSNPLLIFSPHIVCN